MPDMKEKYELLNQVIEELKDQPGAHDACACRRRRTSSAACPMDVQKIIADGLGRYPERGLRRRHLLFAVLAASPRASTSSASAWAPPAMSRALRRFWTSLCRRAGHRGRTSTTEDGLFTLQATRCLGACGLAPVMTINDEVYGRLVPEDIPGILAKYTRLKPMRDLSLHVLDIAQNSVSAGASLVTDFVCGGTQTGLTDPPDPRRRMRHERRSCAARVTRSLSPPPAPPAKWGWAFPLMSRAPEHDGRRLSPSKAEVGHGTAVFTASFADSIDCIPLGEIWPARVVALDMCQSRNAGFYVPASRAGRKEAALDTREVRRGAWGREP